MNEDRNTGTTLYSVLKGQAYGLAMTSAGRDNPEAQREGYRDVFDLIMSDSDHNRQQMFLAMLPGILSEPQRKALLDGMAREYADADGWMDYVDREDT